MNPQESAGKLLVAPQREEEYLAPCGDTLTLLCMECGKLHPCPTAQALTS